MGLIVKLGVQLKGATLNPVMHSSAIGHRPNSHTCEGNRLASGGSTSNPIVFTGDAPARRDSRAVNIGIGVCQK